MERVQSMLRPDQYELFLNTLRLAARKCLEDETKIGVEFPHVTAPDGSWRTYPASLSAGYLEDGWTHGNWTCGFWIGVLVAGWLATENDRCLAVARERMQLIAPRNADPNTHDIGFIFESSAIPLYNATGDHSYARTALAAAERLRARFVLTSNGGYIASWGPLSDPRGRAASAIDTMANLPLLFWATRYSGDDSFALAAEAHALKTREAFIRDDMGTYHAVEYDPRTAKRLRGYTFQGYADESLWSRGQAWAIYGFSATAEAVGNAAYLEIAERLAERYLQKCAGRIVPPWDFDDPDGDQTLDSSTAAIVASAFLHMGEVHPDPESGDRWIQKGIEILHYLCSAVIAGDGAHRGLLKHGCYSKPQEDGTDSAVMFGDYFFVEALCRALFPGRFTAATRRLAT